MGFRISSVLSRFAAACVALFVLFTSAALAQTVPLGPRFVLPFQTVVDANGTPIPGALLNFYVSGTNTRLNTYSDPLLTAPNSNPVVANSAGVFPNIFLNGNYKVVLTDSSGDQIWTADPVYSGFSGNVNGPAVSVVGCAAPWADTAGTLLANNCGLQFSGSNLLLTDPLQATLPLVKPTAEGQNYLFQTGSKTAYDIYGPSAPAGLFDYDNIRNVIDIEPTVGAQLQNYNASGVWIWDNVAAVTTGGITYNVPVGYASYCVNAVANASCFGINPAFTDSYDGTAGHSVASVMTGGEIDFTTENTGSTATGFSFVLQGTVQPAGADVEQVFLSSGSTAQWTNGWALSDGALKSGGAGLILGSIGAASGSSISSDPIVFNIFDTSSAEHHLYLTATPNGTGSQLSLSDGSLSPLSFLLGSGGGNTISGGTAAGSSLTLQSTTSGSPSGDFVQLVTGGADVFDCNKSNSGYCTIKTASGLALNNLSVVQVAIIESNNTSGYRLAAGAASATAPTFVPDWADLKAGIGAAASGDVSIVADVSSTATEIARFDTSGLITLPLVTTGTPATYACFDSSNHLIKSSTAC